MEYFVFCEWYCNVGVVKVNDFFVISLMYAYDVVRNCARTLFNKEKQC